MSAALRLRVLLPLAALAVLLILTSLAGLSFARALQRPVVYTYFDEALARSPDPALAVTWQPGTNRGRPFGPVEAAVAGRALTEAWALHAAALATQNTSYLADRFSGIALARATASARQPDTRMVVLHQQATPLAFHRDGSVLQVADSALTARFTLKDGDLQAYRLTKDENVTTLVNEASGWHILSHERRSAQPVEPPPAPAPNLPRLAGINYYPSATPWHRFWPEFDLTIIRSDLALIRGLGANSVRIFLQRTDFLDPDVAPGNLQKLRQFLRAAQDQGLLVVPTLFDLRGGYEPSLWADDFVELQNVLPVLAAAPNVAFVDIKNEIDLDYGVYGKGTVKAWLRAMTTAARIIAPELSLTIGWSSAEAALAEGMTDLVDVVTYHDFLAVDLAAERLAKVRAQAAGKAVIITEIGASSWSALLAYPSSAAAQSEHLAAHGGALLAADGLFVWTLHDFPKPDLAVVGRWPWRKSLQSHYGLFDADSQAKPAATAVRTLFTTLLKGITP